jgi:hypothetical protein
MWEHLLQRTAVEMREIMDVEEKDSITVRRRDCALLSLW